MAFFITTHSINQDRAYFENYIYDITTQDLNSTETECIEYCTNECLNNSDIYECFNNCTLDKCEGIENPPSESSVILSAYGKITLVIFLVFGLFINLCVRDEIRNFNYWLL